MSDETADRHAFPCQSCGADLTFAPGTAELICEYCGHQQVIISDAEPVREIDFHEGLAQMRRRPANELVADGKEVECKGCGARTVLDGPAGHCPYCDSPMVVSQAREDDEGAIVPASLLPFKVERTSAREAFHSWLKSLWFAPNDVKKADADRLQGVYLPYWTYDSRTTTRYTGQRGEHYYVTVSYTDSEGKSRTRQERRTRWYPASGTVYVTFDDILVCASRSLPVWMVERLEPWDLEALKPYDPAYLSGFSAERHAVDLEAGFKIAEEKMEPGIRSAIRRDIGGDEQRISSTSTSHSDVTFKHFLLPLWISAFRYREKVYRFTVNARTGEVAGERPWSWIKIGLLILTILAALGGGYWWSQRSRVPPPPPPRPAVQRPHDRTAPVHSARPTDAPRRTGEDKTR
jgi:Zn finger protein HypA/HybF involved in hydrogenase expression